MLAATDMEFVGKCLRHGSKWITDGVWKPRT